MTDAAAFPGTVVLTNVMDIDGNPYLRLWGRAVHRSGARLLPLTAATVWANGADRPTWVHLQWPERSLRDPSRRATALNVARLIRLLVIARGRGARVMVTAHNVWSHDGQHRRIEALLWWLLGLLATDLHLLSAASEGEFLSSHPTFRRTTRRVIPHGNYQPLVAGAPSQATAREKIGIPMDARVLVTFGVLKSYKGVDALLDAFAGVHDPQLRLIIAGRAADHSLTRRLAAARAADSRLIVIPRFVDETELAGFVRASDCVVLPYRRILNSGSAVLALTLGRPVLLPRTASFDSLRREVGEAWVSMFDQSLSAADLEAIPRLRDEAQPDLAWCSWDRVAELLTDLWRDGGGGQGQTANLTSAASTSPSNRLA
jgi:beta-1,4-mannosyltransferase